MSLAGVTRSRAALQLKGRTSSELVAEMAVGARIQDVGMLLIDFTIL
jgi:hypothetical protein